ncbi:alpha/beta hydrolase [Mesorhizobium sp. CAU 1732]|uniref:alpha/beta fold hydrolase n=1 Tax=Mesorhizobium sp. CAU 1732 TaxID=3140358 RepID=UPI0032608640
MNIAVAAACFLLALLLVLAGVSRIGAWVIERNNPPAGTFVTVDETRLHTVHVPADPDADLPPLVFIHGASGNLLDQMFPIRPLLEGRAQMLFFDRPGHGWSERGPGNANPYEQADTLAALMDHYGMDDAIIVGHSFGGAVTAAFALNHPDKTRGLVFLSAATHPWPGAGTAWYYKLSAVPVLGRLFTETLAWPGGSMQMRAASASVFSPNRLPETYLKDAAISLVLRPSAFRWNAMDVAGLYDHVVEASKRYPEIKAPTVIITGNRDTVVLENIHSVGLARDIAGSELVWVDNLGHKPDWIAPDLVVAAIEKIAGRPIDLEAAARVAEARIAGDARAVSEPGEGAPDVAVSR